MKKFLLTLVLLVGIVAGLFAQKLTYQAVIRDNNQQLVVNTAVKATVTIDFAGDQADYTTTIADVSTNLHGLLTIEFGDDALIGRDWTDATIAVRVVNADDESTVYVGGDARPVSAVPYALSVNGTAIQQYLTEHKYVTEMQVGNQIHDSISNVAGKFHTHDNKDLLDTYDQTNADLKDAVEKAHIHGNADILNNTTAPYTDADSTKLDGIESGAQKNVQSDWKQTDGSKDDYIKNKPSITDTVNNILTTGKYVTETTLDSRHYLTSDSTVITTMQGNISKNANSIDNLILHTAKAAIRDSVAGQIHDSISNVAGKAHTHDNKALLDTYTQTEANLADAVGKKHTHDNMAILNATTAPYTDADSTKLDGIEAGAQKNVQSDWKQTDGSKDDYIKNKPSITDTVNNILSTGGYVTADALDNRHYLTSDSTVITTMQGHISTNKTNIQTNAGTISALTTKEQSDSLLLAGRIDALENASMDCNDVKDCIKDTLSKYTPTADLIGLLQQLEDRIAALSHKVDSLAALIPGGDTTEVADGQPCPGAKTVSDGTNTYNTVKIGNQCWMKENLRTTTNRKGVGHIYTENTQTGYNAETYGYYYDWAAVMQNESGDKVRGICPEGWHVPSDAEWTALTDYVKGKTEYQCDGVADNIANALSAATGWQSPSECGAGYSSTTLNATGFSAVPAGVCFSGSFDDFGSLAYFWSATQYDDDGAWCRGLTSSGSHVLRRSSSKDYGFSVRCLKDEGGSSATLPTVTTTSVSNITHNSATSGGNVTADGGANVTARGVCWSTSQNPTIADSHTTDGSGTGSFTSGITYVTDTTTTYYVRAYATNSKGTAYGNQVNFTIEVTTDGQPCPSAPTVSDGEGHIYNTVKIGNQCWMKENLRTITGVTVGTDCWHADNNADNDTTYGLLYSWAAVMQDAGSTNYPASGSKVQGICPTGWHVPSDAEWDILTHYVFSKDEYKCGDDCGEWQARSDVSCIAKAVSAPTGWNSSGISGCDAGNTGDKANATGFSAVPAGLYLYEVSVDFKGGAYFWSATDSVMRYLSSHTSAVYRSDRYGEGGFSVRCLKDEGGSSATLPTVITASVTNITQNSATSGGDVTSDGGANVTARGVCWSTSQNPTIADSHTADGSGTGNFVSSITSLTSNTTYYVRAYATNSVGTAYGEEVSFTTAQVYPPTVTTNSVTNVTHNSATSGGDVTADGGANVTARGVCWSTNQNPTIADSHTADGSGTGSFSSSITGLSPNTTYYVRAYATNSVGTAYGEEVSFTTISLPTVTTDSASTVTNNSAKLYGNVTDMGEKTEVNAGFKYGTSESTLTSIVVKDAAMTATGQFSCDLTGLTANTQYYFKAFAANGTDTVYGEVKNFRTLSNNPCPNTPTVTDIENNVYNTVQIGNQCWMAENLRTTTNRKGVGNIYTNNTTDGYNAETYGYYYDWAAVMQDESGDKVRGICPEGWHVPSDAEWDTLTRYVYNSTDPDYKCSGCSSSGWDQSTPCIANALSSSTGWQSPSDCGAGHNSTTLNATGFSAVPAGVYFFGRFEVFGYGAYFWSATQSDDNYAWYRDLGSPDSHMGSYNDPKGFGFSVRCLKD